MRKSRPYVIAEMGVNFYDTAKAKNITPLDNSANGNNKMYAKCFQKAMAEVRKIRWDNQLPR